MIGWKKALRASWRLHAVSDASGVTCRTYHFGSTAAETFFGLFTLFSALHESLHALWCSWSIVRDSEDSGIERMAVILNMEIRLEGKRGEIACERLDVYMPQLAYHKKGVWTFPLTAVDT